MEELVSVIIPVYNVENYFKRCMESVLNQSYHNLEIILVDDGSTDNSGRLCDEYKKKDDRIKVIHKDNEGLGITRNRGLEKATGKYVTFIDSDDFIPSNSILGMVQEIEKYNCDLVIGNYYYGEQIKPCTAEERCYHDQEVIDYVLVHLLGNKPKEEDMISVSAWGKLFKRDIIEKNQLKYPSERKLIWEDIAFNLDYIPLCSSVYVSHIPRYHYCFNGESLTHKYNPDKLTLIMKMYEYVKRRVSELDIPDEGYLRLTNGYIGHIRTCLKLEVFYSKKNGMRKAYDNVRKICNDKRVIELIRSFPDKEYSNIQRIYSREILLKHYWRVYFLTWLQLKRKRID